VRRNTRTRISRPTWPPRKHSQAFANAGSVQHSALFACLRHHKIGPSIGSLSDKLQNISARLIPATSDHLFAHPDSTCPLARTMYTTFTLICLVQSGLYLSTSWPQLIRHATPADRVPGPASSRRTAKSTVMISRHLDEVRPHMWMATHV
jgi:hypothetical protein